MAGENIKSLRKAMDISARELSEMTGIPDGRIEGWERGAGNPKAKDAATLSEFFGISYEILTVRQLTLAQASAIVEKKKLEKDFKKKQVEERILNEPTTLYGPLFSKSQVLYMGTLLKIPLEELYKLQRTEIDPEKIKLIYEVISMKEKLSNMDEKVDGLRREIALLQQANDLLKRNQKDP